MLKFDLFEGLTDAKVSTFVSSVIPLKMKIYFPATKSSLCNTEALLRHFTINFLKFLSVFSFSSQCSVGVYDAEESTYKDKFVAFPQSLNLYFSHQNFIQLSPLTR